MTKVGLTGAAGRMGRALVRAVVEHPELELCAAWELEGHSMIGLDAGTLAGAAPSNVLIAVYSDEELEKCDTVIDFTAPEATTNLIGKAKDNDVDMIIGTTGLSPEQHQKMQHAAEDIGIVYATNFSTGVNLLWMLAKKAASVLGEFYNAEIIEAHHNMKKDAPSGTALTLLESICEAKELDPSESVQNGREGLIGARQIDEVGVHAVRAGDIVGDHTALFAGPGERLEIKHQAHSRDTFARGAARAAAWLAGKKTGLYHMSDVLGLED